MKLYIIAGNGREALGGWTPALIWPRGPTVETVHAFQTEADAWLFLLGVNPSPQNERAMRTAWRVVKVETSE